MKCEVVFIMVMSMVLLPQFGDMQSSLSPVNTLNATECYPVVMTCNTTNLSSLNWFFNTVPITNAYTLPPNANLPTTIHNSSGVVVEVTNASITQGQDDLFSAVSILSTTTLALSRQRVDSISCGTTSNRSEARSISLDVQTIPTFTCNIASSDDALNVFISFTTPFAVERYRVKVSSNDSSSCSSDQVSPSEVYNCSGLSQEALFTVSAFPMNCSELEGDNTSFTIMPKAPRLSNALEVTLVYSQQNSSLDEVLVEWTVESQDHISEECSFSGLNYTVTLSSSEGKESQDSKVCTEDRCSIRLSNLNTEIDRDYFINLNASNGVGHSNVTSEAMDGSFLDFVNASVNSGICLTIVYCIFPDESQGNCSFKYGQHANSNMNETFVSTSLTLPLLEPDTSYHSIFTIYDSIRTIQIKGTFISQVASRLTGSNQIMLAIGVVLFIVAIGIAVTVLVLEAKAKSKAKFKAKSKAKSKAGKYVYSRVMLVVGVLLLVVCVAWWIVVCAIVIPQEDTCDSSWQSTRDVVIILALVFAIIFLVFSVAAALRLWKNRNLKQTTVSIELNEMNSDPHQYGPNNGRDNEESSIGGTQEDKKTVDEPPQASREGAHGSQDEQTVVEQSQTPQNSQQAKSDGSQAKSDGSQDSPTAEDAHKQPPQASQTSSHDSQVEQTMIEQPQEPISGDSQDAHEQPQVMSSDDSQDKQTVVEQPQAQAISDDSQNAQTVDEQPQIAGEQPEVSLEPRTELEKTDIGKLPPDRVKMLSTFRTHANMVLADLLKSSMNADDALEHLEKHNFDYDKAMDEIKQQNRQSQDDGNAPRDDKT